LRDEIEKHGVKEIFEEAPQTKKSIAYRLSLENGFQLPWHNIDMDSDQRRAAGIWDALQNRPSRPDDDMLRSIERRIPEDTIREDFLVEQILHKYNYADSVLIVLGDMHVQAVAEKLRAAVHSVDINAELVLVKRWEA
jgi:hypothetical protein